MDAYDDILNNACPAQIVGSVADTTGSVVAVADFPAPLGAIASIERTGGGRLEGEVVGFRQQKTILFPFGPLVGVRQGSRVQLVRTSQRLRVGDELLGRLVDAHGQAIDGRARPMLRDRACLDRDVPPATQRPRIDTPFATGIRVIDGLLRCGEGQRLGIFAGAGVGKSVLMGMLSRYSQADVNVIALVGERGREVNEFVERDLGPEGLARSVIVVATSDEPAVLRLQAAYTATAIAEYFRDRGKKVLLMVDSVTRFATALRETGLAAGEPPATRGYPPSMFATLPKLVERAGRTSKGSITAFYSVLVEGDDANEPVADTIRGLLDGHIWLSRRLATSGHFPAVDVLESISRLMNDIMPLPQRQAAMAIRSLLATYREHEDLIAVGAYRKGSNRKVDAAIEFREAIEKFVRQETLEHSTLQQTSEQLLQLGQLCLARLQATAVGQPATNPAGTEPQGAK
jgi:flagellum-specific ATP synthase